MRKGMLAASPLQALTTIVGQAILPAGCPLGRFQPALRASLGWQAEACPTHAAQPPGDGQTPLTGLAGAISSVAVSRDRGSRQELNVQLVVAAFAITVCPQQLAHLRWAAAHRTKLVPHDLDQP